jgi:hypothetical protein
MRTVSSFGLASFDGLASFKWRINADMAAYTLAADVASSKGVSSI